MLRARLEAMDAVGRGATKGAANDTDTSSSVLGKRTRNVDESLAIEPTEMGNNGRRPRGDALVIAFAAEMSLYGSQPSGGIRTLKSRWRRSSLR